MSRSRRRGAVLASMLIGCVVLAGCGRSAPPPAGDAPDRVQLESERMKMGTRFSIQLVTADPSSAELAIEAAWAEIDRVEELLSEWRETSEISELNRRAGEGPLTVGPDLYSVVETGLEISRRTGGAFDMTFAGCGSLWSIRDERMPTEEAIAACLGRVGHERVGIDGESSSIDLPEGMKIGIAGIGKGYGVDRAAELLESLGVEHYIVDGGGDIRLRGENRDRPWRVGIAHPRRRGAVWATLEPSAGAIVTSGDYERYFERDGERYHHILDPATGRPARHSVAVTVLAPDATRADALATGFFVLGPERALALAEQLPEVELMIFGPDLQPRRSSGFPDWTEVDGEVAATH